MSKSQSSSSEILQPSQPPSIRSLIMGETSCTIGSTRETKTVTTSSPSNICLTFPQNQWESSTLTENYGINTNSNSGSVMRGSFLVFSCGDGRNSSGATRRYQPTAEPWTQDQQSAEYQTAVRCMSKYLLMTLIDPVTKMIEKSPENIKNTYKG